MSQYWQLRTNLDDKTNIMGNADTEGYGQISVLLSKYVLKEKGKGLSSNDYTDGDKQKLDSIQVGAEENVLETISVNHETTLYPDEEKNININIPTKISQLENDGAFANSYQYSQYPDYRDSYVGKSLTSFEQSSEIAIGKDSNAENKGIAIGENSSAPNGIAIGYNTSTDDTYNVNIYNLAKHNTQTQMWEMKTTESALSDVASKNSNGTNLNELDNVINDISNIGGRVTTIESYIPNEASNVNQLADKSYVNDAVSSNSTNFRGTWANWEDVPYASQDYPEDYSGNRTPTRNDYMVVTDVSDYTEDTITGTWRFKYTGNWEINGKNGWLPEYQINEEPLTPEQILALNSGITSTKVGNYDSHLSDTNNPHSVTASQVGLGNVTNVATESTITEDSSNNITSGAVYDAIESINTDINGKNDIITVTDDSTALSDSSTLINTATDSNPTSFTRNTLLMVWTYINGKISSVLGLTAQKVTDYDSHLIDTANPHNVTASQVGLGNVTNVSTESVITEDSGNNITSGAVYDAIESINTDISGKNDTITVTDDNTALSDSDTFVNTSTDSNPTSWTRKTLLMVWTYINGKISSVLGLTSQKVTDYDSHLTDTNNPHSVTANQVGLGNVTNVATESIITEDSGNNITSGAVYDAIDTINTSIGNKNDTITVTDNSTALTDSSTFVDTSTNSNPTSWTRSTFSMVWTYINDKISTVLGLTSQKVSDYDSHLLDTNNPHSVTASQVGLGNVTNVATESTITEDSSNNITSGAVYSAIETINTSIGNKNDTISVSDDSTAITDSDTYVNTATDSNPTSWTRKTFAMIWTYINGKISSVLGLTSQKVSDYDSHLINTSNPHSVTATQVGLGNVTNVATESVITEDSSNNITSGAVYTALADIGTNKNDTISVTDDSNALTDSSTFVNTATDSNPTSFTRSTFSAVWTYINGKISSVLGLTSQKVSDYDSHLVDTNNPHSVTASQVGLGNVTNVATESTITEDSSNNITSGAVYNAIETINTSIGNKNDTITVSDDSTALTDSSTLVTTSTDSNPTSWIRNTFAMVWTYINGKISSVLGLTAQKVSDYDSHLINTSNPHSVTASQVGLGNVTNVATESTITEDSSNNITSGAVYDAIDTINTSIGNKNDTITVTDDSTALTDSDTFVNTATDSNPTSWTRGTFSMIWTYINGKISSVLGLTAQKVSDYDSHLLDTANPHSVTATQVGLGNVTNVSTTDTITEDSTSNITSGAVYDAIASIDTDLSGKNDTIGVSDDSTAISDSDTYVTTSTNSNPTSWTRKTFSMIWTYINGKISSVLGLTSQKVSDYDSHLTNTNNPHSVTATQVGLGNVTNVATESTITEDSGNNITSGAVYDAIDTINTSIGNKNDTISVSDDSTALSDNSTFTTTSTNSNPTSWSRGTFSMIWTYINGKISSVLGLTSQKVTDYDAHLLDTANPHSVTATQVGLGNVDNTADSDIPLENGTTKFTTGGAYNLLVSLAPIFDDTVSYSVNDICTYNGKLYECTTAHSAGNWDSNDFTEISVSQLFVPNSREINGYALSSDVTLTKSDIGLGNVDNTSDSNIPLDSGTTKFTTGGAYNLLTSIAPYFDDTQSYAVDDICTYEGKLYKCTTAHSAGDWDSNDFTEITISENFYQLGKLPLNTVSQSGIVTAPTVSNANKVWKTDEDGIPSWRDESGGGGTSDYEDLTNKPSINGIEVEGDKDGHEYNLIDVDDLGVLDSTYTQLDTFRYNQIPLIFEYNNTIYISVAGNGLYTTTNFNTFTKVQDPTISSLTFKCYCIFNDTLILGSLTGLYKYSYGAYDLIGFSGESINSMTIYDNNLYVATSSELSYTSNLTNFTQALNMPIKSIQVYDNKLYAGCSSSSYNTLYVSTDGTTFDSSTTIPINKVVCYIFEYNNVLYVSTGAGLYTSSDGITFTLNTSLGQTYLLSQTVYNNVLYIGTEYNVHGLFYSFDGMKFIRCTNFKNNSDFINPNSFFIFNDSLYIGTDNNGIWKKNDDTDFIIKDYLPISVDYATTAGEITNHCLYL